MIRELKANGFKSLTKFSITLTPGLNALIGPNGAGKSNICQAAGLLSALAEDDMTDYILSLGGVGAIFTMCPTSDSPPRSPRELEISCRGEITEDVADETFQLRYSYAVGLRRTKDGIELFKEELHLRRRSKIDTWRSILKVTREEGNIAHVVIRHPSLLGPVAFKPLGKQKDFKLDLPRSSVDGFLPMLSVYYVCYLVNKDLRCLRAWNIDPYLAKKSTDIVEPLVMLPDGRRLASAIYSLSQSGSKKLDEVKEMLSQILPRYVQLQHEVSQDELSRTFSIEYSDGVTCRAPSLPDGVVKIVALIVGILSQNRNSAVIEEPENYLHPWACQWLVEYLRETFTQGSCILTTHSETVLNQVRPNEIAVVSNENGRTEACRLRNQSALGRAIRNSGFGCGYHYVAGGLGGVPE